MIISSIIFSLSFIFMAFVLFNKARAIEKGVYLIEVKQSWDIKLEHLAKHIGFFAKEFPRYAIRRAFHFLVMKAIEGFRKLKVLIYPKISHIVDTVKGKDVPRMRGEVSAFLRSIKEDRVKTERKHS